MWSAGVLPLCACPDVGRHSPAIMSMVVVLPLPFGPTSTATSPGPTVKENPVNHVLFAVLCEQLLGLNRSTHAISCPPGVCVAHEMFLRSRVVVATGGPPQHMTVEGLARR